MRAAYHLAGQCLPDYSCKFSRKDFTLPQLFACLVVKELMKRSYRGAEALLRDSDSWLRDVGLRRAPDHNTLCRAAAFLLRRCNVQRLLDARFPQGVRVERTAAACFFVAMLAAIATLLVIVTIIVGTVVRMVGRYRSIISNSFSGVERSANDQEIRDRFRKLAREHHPDVNPERRAEAESQFKEVGEAYAVLSDEQKRAAYDQLGSNWRQGQDFLVEEGIFDRIPYSARPERFEYKLTRKGLKALKKLKKIKTTVTITCSSLSHSEIVVCFTGSA